MGPHELWDEPWEGLPEEEAAWEWDPVDAEENGPTKNSPDANPGWKRWYFVYHEPRCTNIKISADRDPRSGKWFNPHRSSGTLLAMTRAVDQARDTSDREALRRRVKHLYEWFNQEAWDRCYALLDPRLRDPVRVERQTYVESLRRFKEVYGKIDPWYVRISLHHEAQAQGRADRPFAYVYVVWQDQARNFHMFRERWVRDSGRWFTRVAGLVPNEKESIARD